MFDIIVRADNVNVLNEECWAAQHEGDEYFNNSNLSAWKIWYCLDNDTTRFEWSDGTNGKGVIYRMIDEFNNDVPYDFKNIQFYRQWDSDKQLWSTIPSDNTGVPCYTFSSSGTSSNTSFTDNSLSTSHCIYFNVIKKYMASNVQKLNNNCFFGEFCRNNHFGNDCYNNTFGNSCYNNIFGNFCSSNTIGHYCYNNFFGEYCNLNYIKDYCSSNSFGNMCSSNTIYSSSTSNNLGNLCSRNTIEKYCNNDSFGNSCSNNFIGQSSSYNTFGNYNSSNSIGKYCYCNTFGNYCSSNTSGESCSYNLFGNCCSSTTFGNYFFSNYLGNNCSYIKFTSDSSSASTTYTYYQNNHFGDGCQYILFKGAETASYKSQVQNYKFSQGLLGVPDAYLTIDGKRNRAYETYISRDTDGTIKESVIAEKLDKIIETTYANLVSLRDSSNLIPGQQYRITDYQCTTVQENTRSANHPFDIVVTADTVNTLNGVARAIQHEGDEYFANNDLDSWKIWYCIDNDTDRFAWADSTNGKGVIYRMIDEFNNDVPYDFKNIQFKHPNDTTTYPYYYYTFASDNVETNTDNSIRIEKNYYSNIIMEYISANDSKRRLNRIVFIGTGYYCYGNTFGPGCVNNSFGAQCCQNTFSPGCYSNNFGSYCECNSLGTSCYRNTFGNDCESNTLGNNCDYNTFGNSCDSNTLGSDCEFNYLDYACFYTSFGNFCSYNTLGNCLYNNSFGNKCSYIKFASDSSANTKYTFYQSNHFGDGCQYILFKGEETASSSAQIQNYNFAQGLQGTSSAYLTIDGKRNRAYETYISKDTGGTIKESVIAEFENKLGNCVDLTSEQTITAAKIFSAGIDLNGTRISKVGSPTNADDVTNKEYVDTQVKTVEDKVNDFKNAGYLYAGIATPETNIGTPEAKVFYIANVKGTYTTFGGIEVTEDDVVILYYDTAWHKVATGIASNDKLTELANKGEVRHIERDLGMYPELEPVPLNAEVTGKYINSDGKYVDASDWNIASIGTVSLGNTYLLNMVSSSNMVLGVALFVSRVYKRDKEGKIIGTTLTPLFSAKNTSIPASGYVLFEAMDDYDEVLICYKPELTTQMLVARWGFKASHATQLRNLRLIVDNKTDFEGIYELLTAGYALNLVGKGNGEPQAFMSRKTGGGNITDGSAVIKEVDGVQPIVWNQLVQKSTQIGTTDNGLTFYPQENGEVLITGVATKITYAATYNYLGYTYKSVANHKAFVQIFGDATGTMKLYVSDDRQAMTNLGIVPWGTVSAGGILFIPNGYDCGQGVRLRFIVNDLTQMFGAGNEPSTYEEYLDRISHYHIADEYAYNAGEVVNYKGVGIKTTNIDGTKSYIRDWSEVMRKYFPDGMTSLNGVKDFFNEKKAVRKWGVLDLGSLEWRYDEEYQRFLSIDTLAKLGIASNNNLVNSHYRVTNIAIPSAGDKIIGCNGIYIAIIDTAYTDAASFKAAVQGVLIYYELSEPVEDIFDKPLNLTYTVINGGTETSLATENSTQFEGSIAYNKDYVAVVDELQMQNRVIQIEFENWEN